MGIDPTLITQGMEGLHEAAAAITDIRAVASGIGDVIKAIRSRLDESEADLGEHVTQADETPTAIFPTIGRSPDDETDTERAHGGSAPDERTREQLLTVLGCVKDTLQCLEALNGVVEKNLDIMQRMTQVDERANQVLTSHNRVLDSHNDAIRTLLPQRNGMGAGTAGA